MCIDSMDYIKYHYEELLKLLIIISSEPKVQLEAYGIGNAEEEMAIDLEFHFNEHKTQLIENGLLTTDDVKAISEIDAFFEARSNDTHESFWGELETHPDWITLRKMASNALNKMGKGNLSIKINVKNETSWFSKNVTSQQITIELMSKYT
ncbi:hypothetical protein MHM89_05470 [Pseudoalteromonas sp. CNC9-20]|uniref:hypothetical protein n=1 Tax=Pseudoalteromonas sp. CNC9-20 TaxID=2917750 RepID=UPI001EF6302A|nr:hypothetical protein [Pseudoalteromonas sp. CNC9-20]MCG7569375.1 hypothetical protein [Pseudoalteromonas sp. CNC9-20]